MKKTTIKIKKLDPRAKMPVYSSEHSAGADIHAFVDNDVIITPGETAMLPSGIALEIPHGFAGLVCARSGLASKKGLAPANKVGVIDSDYRGELVVALYNHSQTTAIVSPGERVAQLLVVPVATADFVESSSLSDTGRGSGGFGSTGET